jgi:hypothetical protein
MLDVDRNNLSPEPQPPPPPPNSPNDICCLAKLPGRKWHIDSGGIQSEKPSLTWERTTTTPQSPVGGLFELTAISLEIKGESTRFEVQDTSQKPRNGDLDKGTSDHNGSVTGHAAVASPEASRPADHVSTESGEASSFHDPGNWSLYTQPAMFDISI